jgi:hypothetical protein
MLEVVAVARTPLHPQKLAVRAALAAAVVAALALLPAQQPQAR